MKNLFLLTCAASALLFSSAATAQEIPVDAPIQTIGLFKNGLAVVERGFAVQGAGTYVLSELPESVHGTFHVECAAAFRIRVRVREVEVDATSVPLSQLQSDLAGKKVTVWLEGPETRTHVGRVLAYQQTNNWSRDYQHANRPWWSRYFGMYRYNMYSQYLVLQTDGGAPMYIKNTEITSILVHENQANTVLISKPVLQVEILEGAPETAIPCRISYLAKGLGWAPSYRVELTSDDRLKLTQNVAIKNELTDFEGAGVSLISGFPLVRFSHVEDPMALGASWSEFFAQLSLGKVPDNGGVYSQTMSISNSARDQNESLLPSPEPGSKGQVHYHPVPDLDMEEGESLYFTASTREAKFDRSIRWIIRDGEDRDRRSRNSVAADPGVNEPWNYITFKNPFAFPMTTAPAAIFQGSQFLAQSQSNWVGAGARTHLPISKASGMTKSYREIRKLKSKEVFEVNGRTGYEWKTNGTFQVTNNQAGPIDLTIQREYAGDLVQADGEPTHHHRGNDGDQANPDNMLVWHLTLSSGESRELTYEYTSFQKR